MEISVCHPKDDPSILWWAATRKIRRGRRFLSRIALLSWRSGILLATLTYAGSCAQNAKSIALQSLAPARAAAVSDGVRALMQTVANDVTRDGPVAWCRYFDPGPDFFMAVNGQMAFPNGAAAQEGTRKFAQTIKHIELKWGDDLRVDPLTPGFAVVAASWREIQVDTAGHRLDEAGYFTGLVQYRNGRWEFRDAHWSAPVSGS